jgi:hypothetical protein
VRTSSFVHGLMTRRAVFAFTVLADFVPLTVVYIVYSSAYRLLKRGYFRV